MNEWILVNERLPELYKEVLVWNDDDKCCDIAFRDKVNTIKRENEDSKIEWVTIECFVRIMDNKKLHYVTHWMRLPSHPMD